MASAHFQRSIVNLAHHDSASTVAQSMFKVINIEVIIKTQLFLRAVNVHNTRVASVVFIFPTLSYCLCSYYFHLESGILQYNTPHKRISYYPTGFLVAH